MKQKNTTIEFFRVVLTICVIIGHIYCTLFRKEGEQLVSMQNMCVDAFFILSGVFLARGIDRIREGDIDALIGYQLNRIKRLFPMYFLVAVMTIIYKFLCGNKSILSYWTIFLFVDGINNFPVLVTGAWYVSALFWSGLIIGYLLYGYRKKALVFHFPIIIFVSMTIMYTSWGGLSLNTAPYFLGFISSGFLKALLGMSVGVELYYVSLYFEKNIEKYEEGFVRFVSGAIEILSTIGIVYCFSRGGVQKSDYLIYFFFTPLLLVVLHGNEQLYKFGRNKIWANIGKYTYGIYLSHTLLLEILKRKMDFSNYNQIICYVAICIFAFVFGIGLQNIVWYIEGRIRTVLYREC